MWVKELVENMAIILAGCFFAYLGFRLYLAGVTHGEIKSEAAGPLGRLILTGTGPGLAFMFFGAVLVTVQSLSGRSEASVEYTVQGDPVNQSEVSRDALLRKQTDLIQRSGAYSGVMQEIENEIGQSATRVKILYSAQSGHGHAPVGLSPAEMEAFVLRGELIELLKKRQHSLESTASIVSNNLEKVMQDIWEIERRLAEMPINGIQPTK